MAADFRSTTTDDVHRFLAQAAYDGNFRKRLKSMDEKVLAAELEGFNVLVHPDDLPPADKRTLPTRQQCQALIAMFGLNDEYARSLYDYNPSRLAPLILVIGHAMPLVATVDSEVAAAG